MLGWLPSRRQAFRHANMPKGVRPLGYSHSVELEGTVGDTKRTAHSGSRSGTPFRTPCRHLGVRFMPIDPANKGVAWALQRTVRRQAGRCIKGASSGGTSRKARACDRSHPCCAAHIFADPYGLVASCSMILAGEHIKHSRTRRLVAESGLSLVWKDLLQSVNPTFKSGHSRSTALCMLWPPLRALGSGSNTRKPHLHQEARSI